MQTQLDEVIGIGLRERGLDAGLEPLFESRQPIIELLRLAQQAEDKVFGGRVGRRRCDGNPLVVRLLSAPPQYHRRMLMTPQATPVDTSCVRHHSSGASVLGPMLRLSQSCKGAAARQVLTMRSSAFAVWTHLATGNDLAT